MNKLIISAPFGNYYNLEGITATIGTYTLHNRGGLLKRFWKVISTVRYYKSLQSWVNKLGLPNPGIHSLVSSDVENKILSIHGFDEIEWFKLIKVATELKPLMVELNFSCPNVNKNKLEEMIEASERAIEKLGKSKVIAKLPPIQWMKLVNPLYKIGINCFHLCNTIPSPKGGLSGKVLKPYSLWAVEEVKQTFGNDVKIIGGGGITSLSDIEDYQKVGADYFSIGSMLLNPFNYRKLKSFLEFLKV